MRALRWFGLCAVVWGLVGCASPSQGIKGDKLVPFAPEGSTAVSARPKRYALLVGINTFDDPDFHALRFAKRDAEHMAKAFHTFDEVRLLVEPEETTQAHILAALHELKAKATHPQDTLVVYISSHGVLAQRPGRPLQRYIATHDARLDEIAQTALAVQTLTVELEGAQARRHALVLAMCHSGRGKSQTNDALTKALSEEKGLIPLEEVSEATIVVSASSFGEPARESEELEHDIYTYFLLEGMKRGDKDSDGAITISEAHDYARTRTYAFSNGYQRPTSETFILGRDPIVLTGQRTQPSQPTLYSYDRDAKGIRVVVDGVSKGVLPGNIVVPPGSHALQLEDEHTGELLYQSDFEVALGERHNVLDLIVQEPTWHIRSAIGAFGLIDTDQRRRYFPWSSALTVALERRMGTQGWVVGGTLTGLSGQSDTPRGSAPNFELLGIHAQGTVGWRLALWNTFTIVPGAGAGVLWAQRSFAIEGDGLADQSLTGWSLQGHLRADWTLLGRLNLGVHTELGTLLARFEDERQMVPYLHVAFGAGWAWD